MVDAFNVDLVYLFGHSNIHVKQTGKISCNMKKYVNKQ